MLLLICSLFFTVYFNNMCRVFALLPADLKNYPIRNLKTIIRSESQDLTHWPNNTAIKQLHAAL